MGIALTIFTVAQQVIAVGQVVSRILKSPLGKLLIELVAELGNTVLYKRAIYAGNNHRSKAGLTQII